MAMGRQKDGQGDLMVSWSEMPRSPGHVFYDRLQPVLIEGGFDAFAEASCRPYYAARMGAPSVPPGCYFRMHLVGYFEGIDSERGLEWRCSDSLSLRAFLRLGSRDRVPDHSWLSRSRTRLPHEVHAAVFDWALVLIAEAGLIKGERMYNGRKPKDVDFYRNLGMKVHGSDGAPVSDEFWTVAAGRGSGLAHGRRQPVVTNFPMMP